MTESHSGYRIPSSQMEDVSIDNRDDGNTARLRTPYVSSKGKSARFANAANHWDFFLHYKITVITGVISILTLLLFSASVIYMAVQSAQGFPPSPIEKTRAEKPVTVYKRLKNYEAEKIDRRENTIRRQAYEIVPEILTQPKKREVRKVRKREVQRFASRIIDDTPSGNIVLQRVKSGSEIPLEVDIIPYNRQYMKELFDNDVEDERNIDKRELRKTEKNTDCQRRSEHCKLVMEKMQRLITKTDNNVQDLKELVNTIRLKKDAEAKDPKEFQDFLQCVECGQMATHHEVEDAITFINDSDGTPAIYEQHLDDGKSARMKTIKNIDALLNSHSPYWSSHSSSSSSNSHWSDSSSSEEYRSNVKNTKAREVPAPHDNSVSKFDMQKSGPNVERTVQVSKSTKMENGTQITSIVKNTTIIKTQSEGGSDKETQQTGTSTEKTVSFDSLKPIRQQTIMEVTNIPSGATGPSANPYPSAGPSPSGWSENTKSEAIMEEFRYSNKQRTGGNHQQGWNKDAGPPAGLEPRIMTGPQYQQSRGDASILPTAETMMTSQQVQYTPGMSWMSYPVCFFGKPPVGLPTAPFKQSIPGMMTFPSSSAGGPNYPFVGNQYPLRSFPGQTMNQGFVPMQFQQQQGTQFVPFQQMPQGQRVGPSGTGNQNFVPNFGSSPTGPGVTARTPVYCTYMPTPTFQFPTIPGVSEFHRSAESSPRQGDDGDIKEWSVSDPTWNSDGNIFPGYTGDCGLNSHRCFDGSLCIPKKSWCDGNVNCPDASDETRCSCRDRIGKDRICDGYFDCPHGEDELGCFGCPVNTFSCENWSRRYRRENCVPMSQRCDGIRQCSNGKDEKDCNILTGSYIEERDLFTVGYSDGYLHKNWKGRWYPVCSATEVWAADACLSESCVPTKEKPLMEIKSIPAGTYREPYVYETSSGEVKIIPTCFDKAIYVNCPQIPCGTRDVTNLEDPSPYDPYEDSIVAGTQNQNNETSRNAIEKVANEIEKLPKAVEHFMDGRSKAESTNSSEIVRIVGGKASRPKAWPFLVAIFIDGYFHCGGAIIDPQWILTAAHCVDGFPSHYYEITAGLLRRYSFSPTAQIRRAHYIKIHPSYDKSIMKNDIALIRLNEPLRFNRWIRATCLPKSWKSETLWKKSPLPDTTCVAVGWGATVEHGPNPDHLREVEIPILPECKYPEERNDAEICAGMPRGGRDSCQGDSGGPLLCKYPNTENQWYVAGITSHGWGCARPNEPGAYTKVSRFVDWIDDVIHTKEFGGLRPLQMCPGFSCAGGLGKCIPMNKRCDKVVNCLDAEDEMNCRSYHEFPPPVNKPSSATGSEWVGQGVPDFVKEIEKKKEAKSDNEGHVVTSGNSAKQSVFTMEKQENSTTTVKVETGTASSSGTQKNVTDATSVNGTVPGQPMATTSAPQSPSQQSNESNKIIRFACTKITQSIPINERCNRVIDCEDGTDEDNCSCKDYLANLYPIAICDGHVDCYDGSDEENCTICNKDEFVCSRSGKCIAQWKMCDRHTDCPHMEDELDCFSLTSGNYVIMDIDKRPHLNLEGVVTERKNGMWRPACQEHNSTVQKRLSDEFCVYFGFSSAKSVEEIIVQDATIEVRQSTKDNVIPYEYPPPYEKPEVGSIACLGLYVQCAPVLSADKNSLIATNPKKKNLSYLWPWQGAIYVDGRFHCPAVLLEDAWLLATSRCIDDLDLRSNYTVALLGIAPTYRYVDGPYQQIASIDAIKIVPKLDAALLHLQYPVNMTRYVQPIFIEKKIVTATKNDYCVATGVDERHRMKTTLLQPVPEKCPACHRCYTNGTIENCRNNTSTNWSGTIVCRGSGLWYPAAIFHEKDLVCGFQTKQALTSIDYGNRFFTEIMDKNLVPTLGPNCDGMRCPLGKCIPWTKVCNGIDDCRDGSDEKEDYCGKRQHLCKSTNGIGCKCSKSELRCASGQCVPKEAFCDNVADCDDRSDEPAECTCGDYLKLTAPERLCDNVRHCLDKSDENNEQCICKDASFKCNRNGTVTETCVSQDFVCDDVRDCANGEDEKTCRRVRGTLNDPSGTGEVIRRSFGVWHSECFPSPIISVAEISDLCKSMGYSYGRRLEIDNEINPYGTALVPEVDEFYMIRLNSNAWLTIRDPKPLVTLVPAKETCHRAFVKCT